MDIQKENKIDLQQIQNLFALTDGQNKKRCKENLATAIDNSNVVVTVSDKNIIVGFSRATSDAIYRAVIWDLIVHPKYQNLGILKKLIKATLSHALLNKVERVYLITTCYQQSFYKKTDCKHDKSTTMIWHNKQKISSS